MGAFGEAVLGLLNVGEEIIGDEEEEEEEGEVNFLKERLYLQQVSSEVVTPGAILCLIICCAPGFMMFIVPLVAGRMKSALICSGAGLDLVERCAILVVSSTNSSDRGAPIE